MGPSQAAAKLKVRDAIIDGEATVLGDTGLLDFQALRRELGKAGIFAKGGNSPVARECVVELVGLEPTTRVLWNAGVSDQLTLSDTRYRQQPHHSELAGGCLNRSGRLIE